LENCISAHCNDPNHILPKLKDELILWGLGDEQLHCGNKNMLLNSYYSQQGSRVAQKRSQSQHAQQQQRRHMNVLMSQNLQKAISDPDSTSSPSSNNWNAQLQKPAI